MIVTLLIFMIIITITVFTAICSPDRHDKIQEDSEQEAFIENYKVNRNN